VNPATDLTVEVLVLTRSPERAISTVLRGAVLREAEEAAAARVLHALGEGLVAADLDVGDGATSRAHRLLEVGLGQLRDEVVLVLLINLHVVASGLTSLGALDFHRDGLLDGELDSTLGDEAEIGTGEAVGVGGDVLDVDIVRDGRLFGEGLQSCPQTTQKYMPLRKYDTIATK